MDKFKRKRLLLLLLSGISLAAILILAGGLAELIFKPGKPLNLIDWLFSKLSSYDPSNLLEISEDSNRSYLLPQLGDLMLASLIAIFWLMLISSIVMFFVSPEFRRRLIRMLAMTIPLLILLPQLAKIMAQQAIGLENQEVGGFAPGDATFPEAPLLVQNPPEWLTLAFNILILAFLLGGIFYLWRRIRPKPETQAVVVKEVRRALSNLESGSELKDVVIACYAQMCQGLQESQHIKRHKAMTPREFETHLSRAGIASTHIQQLTRLFEDVRYGAQPTTAAAKNDAKRCLRSILEAYGG